MRSRYSATERQCFGIVVGLVFLEASWWAMNPLLHQLKTGTIGELLVQLRLLQYDVQAVSPHKDTGNDLLAIRGESFRAVQVKTCVNSDVFKFNRKNLMDRSFHILALVQLQGEDRTVRLDESRIFLLRRDEVRKGRFTADELQSHELEDRVAELFFEARPNMPLQSTAKSGTRLTARVVRHPRA